jgi:hypothetical protein
VLLDAAEKRDFSDMEQLDRIERLISTREELEDYVALLLEKVEAACFPGTHLLDRVERLSRVLELANQQASAERER